MFLRFNTRIEDGKEHRYWNIVENRRCAGDKVVQKLLVKQLKLDLPPQPPPRITPAAAPCSVDLSNAPIDSACLFPPVEKVGVGPAADQYIESRSFCHGHLIPRSTHRPSTVAHALHACGVAARVRARSRPAPGRL
jgi:hypothetical protein